ncbi:hypothetical protein LTR82_018239 [Friedmanniomyces endolithicus]|uniref:PNPLA domain-containing protein n=1 Tax=Friedmanniomyces endolithicus TaxID=329885 RepID=A0AAN6F480_9PEZI|nr:hypothetical protein LTR82_018239 [Friedmanniomyces endolithicus]
MRRCKHRDLVEISDSEEPCLVDPHRLWRIVESLPDPDVQRPLVVACIGTREKSLALHQLFPANDSKVCDGRSSLCKAYGDVLTAHAACPILYWDIELANGLPSQDVRAYCHQFQAFRIGSGVPREELGARLIQRLLLPFADVICIFAADLGGLQGVFSYLQAWAASGRAATKYSLGAGLVVVVPNDTCGIAGLEEIEFLESLQTSGIVQAYRSVKIQHISTQPLSNARYVSLREIVLHTELDSARADRDARMSLYSGTHLASLFSQSLAHVAHMTDEPFDYVAATRQGIPHLPHLTDCLSAVLRASSRESVPHGTITSILATSLLTQAYPPSSHSFAPHGIFRGLFQPLLSTTFEQQYIPGIRSTLTEAHRVLRDQMVGMVFREFVRGWMRMQKERLPAAVVHQQRLQDTLTSTHRAKVRSNLFCSICALRPPEHVLKCRHAICDHCAKTYGDPRVTEEYTYIFRKCLACGTGTDLLIRLKPPTAGVRILSVDGGGVRGIIPLEFLHLLQRSLGSSCRVQDLFDLALGTSAGGLVVLGLFAKHWDIQHAVATFRALASRFFANFLTNKFPALGRVNSYVRCMLQDSCYKTESLDATLKQSFGEQSRIFDYPESGASQCKIAVTTTTTSTANTRLMVSYTGGTPLKVGCGTVLSYSE